MFVLSSSFPVFSPPITLDVPTNLLFSTANRRKLVEYRCKCNTNNVTIQFFTEIGPYQRIKNREECTMEAPHRGHDISDRVWKLLEPHLPGRKDSWGGKARDNRLFINAVFWILRTGTPWRDLPSNYGDWKNTHRRFCRWQDKGYHSGESSESGHENHDPTEEKP